MFAFAVGFVDTCRAGENALDHVLPLELGVDAGWLLAEALRRTRVLAGFPNPPLRARDRVMPMRGATREDTGGVNPDNLAAISAAWLALAQRMSAEAGVGTLREAMTRSVGGYVAIYAISGNAVLVLIGDEGLDIARLHREALPTVETLGTLLAGPAPCPSARLTAH